MFIDFAKLNYMIKLTFNHLFKLVEPAGNKEEKMLKYDIGIALGKIRIKQDINIWNLKGGRAPGAYKARFAAWLS